MAGEVFDPKKAEKLVDPSRQETVPVEKVLELLQLSGEEKVADLGAGNGYLTLPIAQETKDRVTAVDLQFEMLELLASRAEGEGITNIERMKSSLDSLNLPDASFHRALTAFVLHEVPDLHQTLKEVHRILMENSRLLILDWEKVDGEQGPPKEHRIASNELAEKVAEEGFDVEVGHLNNEVYYIVATK
ncbi:class I SAM-dependent methyltransferase [Pontibacillus salipaludis]|uniref:class I SAM-dependent methyltransferase n=1 Tax=Pontibacillus salipaludis TaxID=1697394 RepID=UPI0031EFC545